MRALSRFRVALLVLMVALTASAAPARSELRRIPVDDDDVFNRTYGGGATDLPVRPNLTWREAVDWARKMPAIQAAMATFAARGYVAITAHDSAYISLYPPATLVAFPYRKPDLSLPDNHYAQPLILVRTALDREGVPSTVVTAGLLILDPVNEAIFTADSLSEYAESDASFDVSTSGTGGGGPSGRLLAPWAGGYGGYGAYGDKSRFYKWVRCMGVGSLGCLRTFFHVERSPMLLVVSFAEPEVVGFYFTICEAVIATGCMVEYYAD